MRKQVLILITICLYCQGLFGQSITDRLAGKWEAVDKEKVMGMLHFLGGNELRVTISGEQLPRCQFVIDTTSSPYRFDITLRKSTGVDTLRGLLAFVNTQSIKWQIAFDGKRTKNFVAPSGDNTLILKRKK